MARVLQLRQGTTSENNSFTGKVGELSYDIEAKQIRVHDGVTTGGKIVDDPAVDVTNRVSDATQEVAGKAKIATTAIAQAGTNDTDFITALKLRNVTVTGGAIRTDITATTVVNTWYLNSTNKPKIIILGTSASRISVSRNFKLRQNGVDTNFNWMSAGPEYGVCGFVSLVVLPNESWLVDSKSDIIMEIT